MLLWLMFRMHLEGAASERIPKHFRALEVLVLSSECVLEPILESGECKTYWFYRANDLARASESLKPLHS